LFDEVEDVFPPISSEAAQLMARAEQVVAPPSGSVSGKAWVNQILESNPVPTLWVTNRIEQIDPAFRRRFAYHLELKSPPPGAREGLVRKTLEGVAGVRRLRRQAHRAQGADAGADPHRGALRRLAQAEGPAARNLIERQLRNADQALGTRSGDGGARPASPPTTSAC
jgi:SpoVK/Ycf46/Vps4 family AAA+-type ATPase